MSNLTLMRTCRVAAVAAVGALFGVSCFAASFSGQIVVTQGRHETKSKIFVTDKKVRRESKPGDIERITIVRADKGVTWQLKPKDKTYVELKSARMMSPDPEELKKFADEKLIGEEKVAGYDCKKYLYTPREDGGTKITVWMSEKLKWPLKETIVHPGGAMTAEYTEVQEGKQDDSLFEVPYYYKKIELETPKTVPPTTKPDAKDSDKDKK